MTYGSKFSLLNYVFAGAEGRLLTCEEIAKEKISLKIAQKIAPKLLSIVFIFVDLNLFSKI